MVSAFGGVTDDLLQAAEAAASSNKNYSSLIDKINIKHKEFAEKLIKDKDKQQKAFEVVESISNELINSQGVFSFCVNSQDILLTRFLQQSERISSFLISSLLSENDYIDSREILKTDIRLEDSVVDFKLTNSLITSRINQKLTYSYTRVHCK